MAYIHDATLGGFGCGSSCPCKSCRRTTQAGLGELGERYVEEEDEDRPPPTAPPPPARRRQPVRRANAGLGLGQAPAAPPAPDSAVANRFIAAHGSRWCTPGQAGSPTCRPIANPRPIRRVVIHTLAAAAPNDCVRFGTVNDVVRNWQRPGEASAHYLVDRNGEITQMVREANVAFHATAANPDSIGIEHADVCNVPAPFTTELYERSAALVRDIAARNGFPIRVFGIDTNVPADATVVAHGVLDPANRSDPGPYWDWEYYARLLRWDGRTTGTRPIRLVSMITAATAPPAGWQARTRVQVLNEARACIPNGFCANRNHSYSERFWLAQANTPGADVVFPFTLSQPGLYKISLWWPNVGNANREVMVQAEIQKAGGPARANFAFDQRGNHGRWNDIGGPFTFTVPGGGGAQGTVRVRRASRQAGAILADAVRILKVA